MKLAHIIWTKKVKISEINTNAKLSESFVSPPMLPSLTNSKIEKLTIITRVKEKQFFVISDEMFKRVSGI